MVNKFHPAGSADRAVACRPARRTTRVVRRCL